MKNKRILLLPILLLLSLPISVFAQTFIGMHASTFGGVSNVGYNPAIADNHFKFDMNLIGVDVKLTNNYIGINRTPLFKMDSFSADDFNKKFLNGHLH